MKKALIGFVLTSLLAVPLIISAQLPPVDPPFWEEFTVIGTLNSISNYLFGILLIVATIFIIIAAYNFVTASGDPDKTKTARNFVLYAVIGVLVGFLAKGLVMFVEEIVR